MSDPIPEWTETLPLYANKIWLSASPQVVRIYFGEELLNKKQQGRASIVMSRADAAELYGLLGSILQENPAVKAS